MSANLRPRLKPSSIYVYILDTNIVSFSVYQTARHPLLVKNFRATKPADRFISTVTAEELIAWRYLPLLDLKSASRAQVVTAYYNFRDILAAIHVYHNQIKNFDDSAYDEFLGMPGNVDINDRRIAAVALSNKFTVVSHDRDFTEIKKVKPALQIQDWVDEDYT